MLCMLALKESLNKLYESVNILRLTFIKNGLIKNYRFRENKLATWNLLSDNSSGTIKLCDYGITKFWNLNCDYLTKKLPLEETNIKSEVDYKGVIITTNNLKQRENICTDSKLYTEPHMTYVNTDIKSKTIKLRPRRKLQNLWMSWMKQSNIIYNATIRYLVSESVNKKTASKLTVRDYIKAKFPNSSIPNTVLEYAVFDAIKAYKQGKNVKETSALSISIDGRNIKEGYIYISHVKDHINYVSGKTKALKEKNKKSLEILKRLKLKELEKFEHTGVCKLFYDSNTSKFYLNHAVDRINKNKDKKPFISLDPGIRSFLTYYDGDTYGEIGPNFGYSLGRLFKTIDKLESKISEINNKRKIKNLRTAQNRLRRKITNKVKDLHYKTIKFLGNYQNVLLPTFKVKDIASKLDNGNTRKLMALSHFSFKQRLVEKTSEIGNRIIICNEAYTSKTCTNCGIRNEKLGSSKVFHCKSCRITLDRDFNGARNIALRVLTFGKTFDDEYCE